MLDCIHIVQLNHVMLSTQCLKFIWLHSLNLDSVCCFTAARGRGRGGGGRGGRGGHGGHGGQAFGRR